MMPGYLWGFVAEIEALGLFNQTRIHRLMLREGEIGGESGIRTPDLRIMIPSL